MNRTRLTPYPTKPSISVPARYGSIGNFAPSPTAMTVFVVPATKPLIPAMTRESAAEIFRVRLLSSPQHRHAAATDSKPRDRPDDRTWPGHANSRPPRKIATNPRMTRRLVASRKTNQASTAVKTASRFNNSEDVAASARVKPTISSTGATMPPASVAAASQGQSERASPGDDH